MPFGKGRRNLGLVLGCFLAGSATIWFSCPLWFPWVLRPLASRAGARFSAYERLGYAQFALHGLAVTNKSLTLRAQRIDALVPSVWLWRLAFARAAPEHPILRVRNWDCDLLPSDQATGSPYSDVQDAAVALRAVQRWLATAQLTQGTVHSGNMVFTIPDAAWREGTLEARIKLPAQASGQTITARLSPGRPFELRIAWPTARLDSVFFFATNQSGLNIQNSTFWNSNRFDLQAHFARSEGLPQTAQFRASDFRFPGELLKLPGYHELTGSFSARWESNQFVVDLSGVARPEAAQTNLPPIDVDLHARGDTNSATLQTLTVHTPFLVANLSNQLTLSFSAPFLRGPATLNLAADLAQQPWIPLAGKLSGIAEVTPGPGRFPLAHLQFAGSDLGNTSLKANSIDLSATLVWPLLTVAAGTLRFADESAATLSGILDLEQKSVMDGRFHFDGPLARRWLPASYSYQNLSVTGSFQGPLRKLLHTGHLEATQVTSPMLAPLALNFQWTGEAKTLNHFDLRISDTNSSLAAAGSLMADPVQTEVQLGSLSLSTNRVSALELAEPVTVSFEFPQPATGWRLVSTPFRWSGAAGELAAQASVRWPSQGALQLSLQHFPLQLLSRFAKTAVPQIDFQQLDASVNWSNGPATFQLDASGSGLAQPPREVSAAPGQQIEGPRTTLPRSEAFASPSPGQRILETPLTFNLKLSGDARGIVISNLMVNSPTSAVAVAHGFVPMTFTPAALTNGFHIDSQQPLLLNASVRPEAFFWENLAEISGLRLEEPTLDLDLSGTWSAPSGKIGFLARSIQWTQTNSVPLRLEDLRLTLTLDRETARLTEGQVLVQGQRVSLTGELPLGQSSWSRLIRKKLPDWEKATARLRVENAELAAFEPLFPELFAPQGDLNLDLQLLPGARLEGAMTLRNARTRPLGNTAPFREINVTLRFHERTLTLESARANLSGAEVSLSGQLDLPGTNWLAGSLPPFNLVLRGTNVPLAREPEYIIRSDLDLAIAKTNDAAPLVSGTARLRDSFYLSDLSDLVPGKIATPSSRPPYFSIDNPALAGWRLAVTVEGVRWLKLRTSLFNGEISANLHLQGTLKDPVALGDLKIDSGVVRFPFANLQVQQGLVTLTSQNPYHPELLVRAVSKQFGYDIRTEVSGPVDSPVIQFTSNPSLSSEQILLMITAGQLPAGSFTLTPQQRAQTVVLFLGKDVLAKLGMGDQSQERLTISSGEEITQQGRPTYHVEYKLDNRWSVEGEYDRFGDFNAGLKWGIYSK